MKYLKIKSNGTESWLELDAENYAIRQLDFDEKGIHLSCFEDCLAEGNIEISELDGEIVEIEGGEFEKKWLENTKRSIHNWESTKKNNPVGSIFRGVMRYYYPQGAVVKNQDAVAIVKENSGHLYPGVMVMCEVVGYDDINQWLIAKIII